MGARTWRPSGAVLRGLFFVGAPKMLRELDRMIRRPWLWWRSPLLPLLYLVVPPRQDSPLIGIGDRLRRGTRIVCSRIDSRNYRPDGAETTVNDLLSSVVADLSTTRRRVSRMRFPHYSLVFWLQTLTSAGSVPPDQVEDRLNEELERFIRNRSRLSNVVTEATIDLADEFPWYVQKPVRWFWSLGMIVMRWRWHPVRWLAKHALGEKYGGSFKVLSQEFIAHPRGMGDAHRISRAEIDGLLVDAFLEDIRRAYRWWTILGTGRRRTSYPVLLIDDARSGSPSLRLLKLINSSRNATCRQVGKQPDPDRADHLLVIARGNSEGLNDLIADHTISSGAEVFEVANARTAFREWENRLRELAPDRSWILPLRVPANADQPGDRDTLAELPLPAGRMPIMTLLIPLILVCAAAFMGYSTYSVHCGTQFWDSQLEREPLDENRSQCVGLAPPEYRFFEDLSDVKGLDSATAQQLASVEEDIHRMNHDAEQNDDHLTVVYLSVLTSTDPASYVVELEQLRGIAIAQNEQDKPERRPVRVLLANAGYNMDYGEEAAENIVAAAKRDTSIVAVIGLTYSWTGTQQAMATLGENNLPTIGTSVSATNLATSTTTYYHQVSPTNQREAQVAALRAKQLGASTATVEYSGDSRDIFSTDLKDQVVAEFQKQKITVTPQAYHVDADGMLADANDLGSSACNTKPQNGVVFFAGRADQLPNFLMAMRVTCQGDYPTVIADDSSAKFVRAGGLHSFPGLLFEYFSFGSSLAFGPDCQKVADTISFFGSYRDMFQETCIKNQDSYAMLGYDALFLFTQAAQNTESSHPNGDQILAGLDRIDKNHSVRGASGIIYFSRQNDSESVPYHKTILLLQATGDSKPKLSLLCGQIDHVEQDPTENDCQQTNSGVN